MSCVCENEVRIFYIKPDYFMIDKERKKMCSNCDGRIPVEALHCPYCGTEQSSNAFEKSFLQQKALQDSLLSFYPPPYSLRKNHSIKQDEQKTHEEKSATLLLKTPKDPILEKKFVSATSSSVFPKIEEKTEKEYQEDRNSFWPILLLSIAANLFIIGILQLLFSDEGYLRLEWNSHYWFFYCLVSLPLFFLGYKKVDHFK